MKAIGWFGRDSVEVIVAAWLGHSDDARLFAWGDGPGRSVAYLAPAVVMEDLRKTALSASEEFCIWRVDHLLEGMTRKTML